MVLQGDVTHVGVGSPRPGFSVIDRVEIGGYTLRDLKVPDRLKDQLEVGAEYEFYIVRSACGFWLLGVARDYRIATLPVAPFFAGAALALLGCIYFCLWAVFESWAYSIGIPMALAAYYLSSICIGLIYFGY